MGLRLIDKSIRLRTWYYKTIWHIKIARGGKILGKLQVDLGNIMIGTNTIIRPWCCLKPYGGYIKVGDYCSINSFVHISGNGGVLIGNNVLIATQSVLVSANHNFEMTNIPISQQGETAKPIIIEDDCWLGAGVKVLAGVTIHKGSVIGAGSVVTTDIPEYSVAVGVPAKVIKKRINLRSDNE